MFGVLPLADEEAAGEPLIGGVGIGFRLFGTVLVRLGAFPQGPLDLLRGARSRGIAQGEDDARDQQQRDGGADREFRAMPPHEFPQEVQPAGCTSEAGLVREMALDVHRQAIGGFVAPRAVLLQGLQHDAIEVAAKLGDEFLRGRPAVWSSAFRRLSSG